MPDSNFRAAFADELSKKQRIKLYERRILNALRNPNPTCDFKDRMAVVEMHAIAVLRYDTGENVDWSTAPDFAKQFGRILEFAIKFFALFD